MIHIATTHAKDNRWMNVQLKYIQRNVSEFKLYCYYAACSPPRDLDLSQFEIIKKHPRIEHVPKLDALMKAIVRRSDPNDIIMVLDGDAFPIRSCDAIIKRRVKKHRLVAVRRDENNGDKQPHPCFMATTASLWKEIGGTWARGSWLNNRGMKTNDVGGKLYHILKNKNVQWDPLLRSNRNNPHELLFGIYEQIVYHHGAGFRSPSTRVDRTKLGGKALERRMAACAEASIQIFDYIQKDMTFYEMFEQPRDPRMKKIKQAMA